MFHLATFSALPILATILSTTHFASPVLALSRDDVPQACRDTCDNSVSMLNSCDLNTSGGNMNKDNSACFCQNMGKSNYKDCANCIRNNQGDYDNDGTYTTYTTNYDNNNQYDNDNNNNNNDYNDNNNNDYNNNNNNDDNDGNNDDYDNNNDNNDDGDYKKRAVYFGRAAKPTPAPRARRSLVSKRGLLDDLLNLDGLVCTVDGVVGDVTSVVGDVTSLAFSLVTEVLDGKTTVYSRNRDYEETQTQTVYATIITSQDSRNSAENTKMASSATLTSASFVIAALIFVLV